MEEEKKQPLDENFLKAILIEPDVPEDKNASLTSRLSILMDIATPTLAMGDDYSISYKVSYENIKDKIMNEEQAYKIRTLGWKLSRDHKYIFLNF